MSVLKNRLLFVLLFCFGTLFSGLSPVFAQGKDFPDQANPPRLVNDFAGFLSPAEQQLLEQKLVAYDDSSSNQIAIVTVQSLGSYEIADYSVQLFNKWGIGGKKNNNGVLILASRDERKIWITTGYGLEGALPDALLAQMIRDVVTPNFKERNFYQGFDEAIDAIQQAARGEYKAEPKKHKGDGLGGISAGLVIFVVIIILAAVSKGGGGNSGGMINNVGWIAASMLSNSSSSSGWGSSSSSGGGGGFGGFGGGSSGGGGAGGSW